MNLSFDEVSRYTIMKTACAEIGMESLSSESIKITKRLTSDIASLETEYERAIQSGDYQKAVDICDQMLSMLDETGTKLKSLNPDKRNEGIHLFAAVLLMIAGIATFCATPIIVDKVSTAFSLFIKKLTANAVAERAALITADIIGGAATMGGGAIATFKGYVELIKNAVAPNKYEFKGDPHANNVDYRIAATTINDAKKIITTLRDNTVAYIKEQQQKATESDMFLLMDTAMECIDAIDGCYQDYAMESLSSDAKKAQKEFMTKAREIYMRIGEAYEKQDYEGTVSALEDLEKLVNEFDRKLDAMKKDGSITHSFGAVVKLAILVLGGIAVIRPNTFTIPLVKGLGKIVKLISGGTSAAVGQVLGAGSLFVGNFAAGTIGFSAIYNAITKAFKARKGKKEHPDDPRYANGDYAAAKEIVKEIRGLIARARIEAMSMKREQPQMT